MSIIKCSKCGTELEKYEEYCPSCGEPIKENLNEQELVTEKTNLKITNEKKKRIAILGGTIIGILLVLVVLIKTHIICLEHEYLEATCSQAESCKYCGKTKGEALGHDWQDATCTKLKTCKRCKDTEGTPLGHDWEAATCKLPEKCKRCNDTKGEPKGHIEGPWDITSEATIITPGIKERKCTVCKETIDTETMYEFPKSTGNAYNFSPVELAKYINKHINKSYEFDVDNVKEIEKGKYYFGLYENGEYVDVVLMTNASTMYSECNVFGLMGDTGSVYAMTSIIAEFFDSTIDGKEALEYILKNDGMRVGDVSINVVTADDTAISTFTAK